MKTAILTKAAFALLAATAFTLLGAHVASRRVRAAEQTGTSANPVIPGDHPDPTVLRVGNTYWMASTSGSWAPTFTLYRSADLSHWTTAGAAFTDPPAWARGDFWAPELVSAPQGVVLYYAARKKDGPLCVAAATAPAPQGPYEDHGPLVCQPDGSIDPAMTRDEHGRPFLIWKEDSNSIHQPTPVWAQPLSDDLVHLTGEKTKLLENDPATWEGGVVEGPYIMRHSGKFFLFYAGNACCGVQCHYAEGVARADHLLGPWEKDPANPIIAPNDQWRCPGHGTAVTTPHGEDYLLYHAYPAVGTIYVGREAVLDRISWPAGGWPVINSGKGPGNNGLRSPEVETDDFRSAHLDPEWKWPIGHAPSLATGDGTLRIAAAAEAQPSFVARSLSSMNYDAMVAIPGSAGADAGLGLIGDSKRAVAVFRSGNHVLVRRTMGEKQDILAQVEIQPEGPLWLRIVSDDQHRAAFSYSLDAQHWTTLSSDVSLNGMPAWDRGLRLGLIAQGTAGEQASFSHFILRPIPNKP